MKLPLSSALLTPVLAASLGSGVASAQAVIPVRELSAPDAISTARFGAILAVRPMAGGGLLVNDGRNRQLVALDATLSRSTIIVDSVAVGGQGYGPRASPLVQYVADSSLFVDGASLSLIVISPTGAIGRVISAPKPSDLRQLAFSASGVDAHGNLLYRGDAPPAPPSNAPGAQMKAILTPSDSLPIVRANFETRKVDTLGHVKAPVDQRVDVTTTEGRTQLNVFLNPLPTFDEWAVLSDGSIAFVRGHDYHVDILRASGERISGPKLAFDWKRLSDSNKQALIDSAKAARERDQPAKGKTNIADKGASSDKASAEQAQAMGEAKIRVRDVSASSSAPPNPVSMKFDYVTLAEIADYYPPIRQGAAKADLDGNVWILPTTSAQSKSGELVYDVVNNRGELAYRVRVPAGKSVAGFGRNGTVYLMQKDASGWAVERTKVVARPRG